MEQVGRVASDVTVVLGPRVESILENFDNVRVETEEVVEVGPAKSFAWEFVDLIPRGDEKR